MPNRKGKISYDVLRDRNLSSTVSTLNADLVSGTNTSIDAGRNNANVTLKSYADVLRSSNTETKNRVDTKRNSDEKENIKQKSPSKEEREKSKSLGNCKFSNVKNQTPKKQENVSSVIPFPLKLSKAEQTEFNGSGNKFVRENGVRFPYTCSYDSDSDRDNSPFAIGLIKNIYKKKYDTVEGLAGKEYYEKLNQLNAIKCEQNPENVEPVEILRQPIGSEISNDYHSDSEEEYISRPIIGFTFRKPISKNSTVSHPTQIDGPIQIPSCNKPNFINGHTSDTEFVTPKKTEESPMVQNTSFNDISQSPKKKTGQNGFVIKNTDEEKLLDGNATTKKQRKRAKRKLREQENQALNKQEVVLAKEPTEKKWSKINVVEEENIEKQKITVEEDLPRDSLEDEKNITELRSSEEMGDTTKNTVLVEKPITEDLITEDLTIINPDEENINKKVSLKIIKKRIRYRKNCKSRKRENKQGIVDSVEQTAVELLVVNLDEEENIENKLPLEKQTRTADLSNDNLENKTNIPEKLSLEREREITTENWLMEKQITEESITEEDLALVRYEEENIEYKVRSEKQTNTTEEDFSIEKTISEETLFEDILMQNFYEEDNLGWQIASKNYNRSLQDSIIAEVMRCCELL